MNCYYIINISFFALKGNKDILTYISLTDTAVKPRMLWKYWVFDFSIIKNCIYFKRDLYIFYKTPVPKAIPKPPKHVI